MNLASTNLSCSVPEVEVIGYTGTIENTEKTEQEEKDTLSQQEKDYVEQQSVPILKKWRSRRRKRICTFVPKVVAIKAETCICRNLHR